MRAWGSGRLLWFCLLAMLAPACDDTTEVDDTLPANALTVLPRSYLVDVELVWSDCSFEGWTLSDGRARAAVTQEQSVVTWTQTGLDARGAALPGDPWRFNGALCAESAQGEGGCPPPPTFESVPVVDAGVTDGGLGAGGAASAEAAPGPLYYLRLSTRVVKRLSFGENVCRAELLIPNTTAAACVDDCEGSAAERSACAARCEGACTRCDAIEFPVKPCSCDVTHTYVEARLMYDEACAERPACTIGLVLSARGEPGRCLVSDDEVCPPR